MIHTRVGSLDQGKFHKDLGDEVFISDIESERESRRWQRWLLVLSWADDGWWWCLLRHENEDVSLKRFC